MSISVSFEYDATECYHALRAITKTTWIRWLVRVMVLASLGAAVWMAIGSDWHNDPSGSASTVVPWLVVAAIWSVLIPWSQRLRARRLPKLDRSSIGTQERTVDADGYHSIGNGVKLDVPWHVLTKVVETDRFFLFFSNPNCAHYLPKRVLNASQVGAVRDLARGALGDRVELMQS